MAILISGVGRSGTTAFYQAIGKGLLSRYPNGRCVYEPYLWHMPNAERSAYVKDEPFTVDQMGLFNMAVHCNTPLFLDQPHTLHDHWLRRVFGPMPPSRKTARDDVLAKVIRGSGRLKSMLRSLDNLKIVVVTRNPIDTINSGLGMFTFFGDELHPSDRGRFLHELISRFDICIDRGTLTSEMQWSRLWWRYFTEASLQVAEQHPNQVLAVAYESYVADPFQVMAKVYEFVGLDPSDIDRTRIEGSAGPTTGVTYLAREDLEFLMPETQWYLERLAQVTGETVASGDFAERLAQRHLSRQYLDSPLRIYPTNLTSLDWRRKYWELSLATASKTVDNRPATAPEPEQIKPLTVAKVVADFEPPTQVRSAARQSQDAQVGVLITCYNNQQTIEEAVFSVLAQTRKPDLIYIADDCSTDESITLVESIAAAHPEVKLVQRNSNVGVAANRDLAIRDMECDFITTLDGDDLYFPHKLESELTALEGRSDAVAFSDYAVIEGGSSGFVQHTHPYARQTTQRMLMMATSRSVPVPRDMLFHKALFEAAEGFDVGMQVYEDWAFKMRLMASDDVEHWVHSGGLGTAYDRRHMGLSARGWLPLAYGSLLALARNASQLCEHDEVALAGLRTVAGQLQGDLRVQLERFLTAQSQHPNIEQLRQRLTTIWENAIFGDNDTAKTDQLRLLSA